MRLAVMPSEDHPKSILSVREAAQIAGKSRTWVRDRVIDKSLEPADTSGAPLHVTTRSLFALLAYRRDQSIGLALKRRAPQLKLIIDNTK